MPNSLSVRQEAICAFLAAYLEAHRWPPTQREIGEAFGIESVGHVNYHLSALERHGYLEREPRQSRCIRLTDAGQVVAEAYLAKVPRRDGAA